MREHLTEELRNDFVDDLLRADVRQRVEDHLAACASCRAEVAEVRMLVSRLAALPQEIAPAGDLRPAIHTRIEAQHRNELSLARSRPPSAWPQRGLLAAAALVLVISTSLVTLLLVSEEPRAAGVPVAQTTAAMPHVEFAALEGSYREAADELLAALHAQPEAISPATLALVEQNIRTIDHAIRETRTLLATDPGNPELARFILAAYEQKLDLLRRATQLGAPL